MNPRLRIYIAVVSALFWFALALAWAMHAAHIPRDVAMLAPLIGLAIGIESLVVRTRGNSISFSATAHIAAAILYGPFVAALVAAGAVIIVDGIRLTPRRYVVMNSAMFGTAIGLAGVVFTLLGGTAQVTDPRNVGPLVALVVVRLLTNEVLLAGVIALSDQRRIAGPLWDGLRGALYSSVAEGCLGILVASSYQGGRWVIMLYLAPLLALLFQANGKFEQLRTEVQDVLETFAGVIDERDPSTAQHTRRVAAYVEQFCDSIGLGDRETKRLVEAARYHDLGKVAVDVATLASTGRLSAGELRAIRRHPRLSARMLAPFGFAKEIALYTELHHERYDGKGYYDVLPAEIPVEAHVLIVADSFDAMTSTRAYRPAFSTQEAAQEVREKAGTQFHPLVASAFAAMVEGADVQAAIGAQQFQALRAEFSRVATLDFGWVREVTGPATAAVLLSASTLISIGAERGFSLWVALQASAAFAAAAWTLAAGVRRRTRERRALTALGRDGTASSALAGAGIGGWVARLDWDPGQECYVATIDGEAAPSPEDLAETLARALRPGTAALAGVLSSGTPFALTAPAGDEPRLAVGGVQLSGFEQRLLGTVAAGLSRNDDEAAGPRLASITDHDRDVTKPYAVILVEVGAFENVRLVAGQLSAERVAADAAERLHRLIRRGDRVVKIGDDRFGVLIAIGDESELEAVSARIREAISGVSIPRRAHAVRPKITAAMGAAAWSHPELAAVAAAFSDGSSEHRVAV